MQSEPNLRLDLMTSLTSRSFDTQNTEMQFQSCFFSSSGWNCANWFFCSSAEFSAIEKCCNPLIIPHRSNGSISNVHAGFCDWRFKGRNGNSKIFFMAAWHERVVVVAPKTHKNVMIDWHKDIGIYDKWNCSTLTSKKDKWTHICTAINTFPCCHIFCCCEISYPLPQFTINVPKLTG